MAPEDEQQLHPERELDGPLPRPPADERQPPEPPEEPPHRRRRGAQLRPEAHVDRRRRQVAPHLLVVSRLAPYDDLEVRRPLWMLAVRVEPPRAPLPGAVLPLGARAAADGAVAVGAEAAVHLHVAAGEEVHVLAERRAIVPVVVH